MHVTIWIPLNKLRYDSTSKENYACERIDMNTNIGSGAGKRGAMLPFPINFWPKIDTLIEQLLTLMEHLFTLSSLSYVLCSCSSVSAAELVLVEWLSG